MHLNINFGNQANFNPRMGGGSQMGMFSQMLRIMMSMLSQMMGGGGYGQPQNGGCFPHQNPGFGGHHHCGGGGSPLGNFLGGPGGFAQGNFAGGPGCHSHGGHPVGGGGYHNGSNAPTANFSNTGPTNYTGTQARARGTGYYPHNSRMEGGYLDMKGKKLHTLQDFLEGRAPYVSVAMDNKAGIKYGQPLRIAELEQKYGRQIPFRVVDTGGAFKGKGTSRIDICTRDRRASLDPTVNGPLTLQFN